MLSKFCSYNSILVTSFYTCLCRRSWSFSCWEMTKRNENILIWNQFLNKRTLRRKTTNGKKGSWRKRNPLMSSSSIHKMKDLVRFTSRIYIRLIRQNQTSSKKCSLQISQKLCFKISNQVFIVTLWNKHWFRMQRKLCENLFIVFSLWPLEKRKQLKRLSWKPKKGDMDEPKNEPIKVLFNQFFWYFRNLFTNFY